MPRPREFDRDEVLQKALQVFWERGYESTSVQHLVDAMGIGRASLYATFGSKHGLFCAVMDDYERALTQTLIAPLEGPGSPRRILSKLFLEQASERCRAEAPT